MAKTLNIQAARGKRELDAPKITAPDGSQHTVRELSLDSYLGILDLEERFEDLRQREQAAGGKPDRGAQKALFEAFADMVTVVLPGFPARSLTLDELFEVLAFVQGANTPETTMTEGAAGAGEVGEAQPS